MFQSKMESENLFRGSLFDQVKDPNLLGFDYLVYEERIFSYLNSIKNRSDYSQLLSFSQKIEKIKGNFIISDHSEFLD